MNKEGNLVLSRKEDLVFVIPPSTEETTISLSVASIKSNQIKLACNAPKRVNIVRHEVLKLI
jgi:carbon storage regulator CsrA